MIRDLDVEVPGSVNVPAHEAATVRGLLATQPGADLLADLLGVTL